MKRLFFVVFLIAATVFSYASAESDALYAKMEKLVEQAEFDQAHVVAKQLVDCGTLEQSIAAMMILWLWHGDEANYKPQALAATEKIIEKCNKVLADANASAEEKQMASDGKDMAEFVKNGGVTM